MTRKEFRDFIDNKIVVLDGATGSNLQDRGMTSDICPERWMVDNARTVTKLQVEFLESGTDILFAPTFTSNRIKLREYGEEDNIAYLNEELVDISKKAVEVYRRKTGNMRKIYIAGDITMTGEMLSPIGKLSFEDLINVYKEQMGYLIDAGVDLFVIETMMSLQECRAAVLAAHEICDLPLMVSLTYQENNRTLYGTDPLTAITVLQSMGVDVVGVNCSTGPEKMHEIIKQMREVAYVPLMAKPNAGIPKHVNGQTAFPMKAKEFAKEMVKIVSEGVGIVGGCCGTTPEHIRHLSEALRGLTPPPIQDKHFRALTTEQRTIPISLGKGFMVVGERINPTGKKALQASLIKGDYAPVVKMAVEQTQQGADFLDINVGMGGIDEQETMLEVIQEVMRVTDVPLSIDTSNPQVMEAALRVYPGRALINSISFEKEKIEKLLPLAKKYGAMFILLPLSDSGLPKSMDEKKEIIHSIMDRAFKLGLTKEDIIVDGLVNTVGANPRAAIEAIEAIRYCKEELKVATIIGLSNISFGLPNRQFINSTFLAFAIQSGLTMAIANPSQALLMNTALASDLLLAKEDSAERYINNVTETNIGTGSKSKEFVKKIEQGQKDDKQVPDNNSKNAIYEAVLKGNRKDILLLVKEEIASGTSPEDIIGNFLIPAINEVGRLYDSQRYFLPQLISGAETMKLAIDYLEPLLSKKNTEGLNQGTIVIATVKGDIHDIGKNLVALMLKNYGYKVIDLGKDVPTEHIIETAKKELADIIAVSALMTTTMVEMKNIVEKAKEAGLSSKVIIGGAVISEKYSNEIGADGYSPDAGSAVDLVRKLLRR